MRIFSRCSAPSQQHRRSATERPKANERGGGWLEEKARTDLVAHDGLVELLELRVHLGLLLLKVLERVELALDARDLLRQALDLLRRRLLVVLELLLQARDLGVLGLGGVAEIGLQVGELGLLLLGLVAQVLDDLHLVHPRLLHVLRQGHVLLLQLAVLLLVALDALGPARHLGEQRRVELLLLLGRGLTPLQLLDVLCQHLRELQDLEVRVHAPRVDRLPAAAEHRRRIELAQPILGPQQPILGPAGAPGGERIGHLRHRPGVRGGLLPSRWARCTRRARSDDKNRAAERTNARSRAPRRCRRSN